MNEPYVFQNHCNHVFLYPYVSDRYCWFVLGHDPRSNHLFENNNVVMASDEDSQGNGNEE